MALSEDCASRNKITFGPRPKLPKRMAPIHFAGSGNHNPPQHRQRDRTGKTKEQLIHELEDLRAGTTEMNHSRADLSQAFYASPVATSIVRLKDECYIEVNHAFERTWGYDRKEIVGRSVADVGIWRHNEKWDYVKRFFSSQGSLHDLEVSLYAKDGKMRTTVSSAEPMDVAGEPCMLMVSVDVTNRANTLETLRKMNAYNQGLMEARLDPLVVIGPDGKISDANMSAEQITGCSREMLMGADFADYFIEPEKARAAYRQALREGTARDFPLELRHPDGNVASVLYHASVCWDEDGRSIGVVASVHDITRRKQAEMRLKESEERYRIAIEASNDGVAIVRGDCHVYVNQRFLEMFGYESSKEIIGNGHKEVHPDDRAMVTGYAGKRRLGEPVPSQYTFKGIRKDGSTLFIEVSVASIMFHGEPAELAYLRDITKRKEMEEKLRTISIMDELTGLYNRRGFLTLAQQQFSLAERSKKGMELIFIDMDGMKFINDVMGHKEGDAALCEVASILRKTFRKSDVIGRLGGDEFAVLAVNTEGTARRKLTERLHGSLTNRNKVEGQKYMLSLSAGVVRYDPDHPVALEELMVQADSLMYEEKKRKKQR